MRSAAVTDRYDLLGAKDRLGTAEGAAAILDALHDVVEALEMFPHKAADARIGRDALFTSVGQDILCLGAVDRVVLWQLRLIVGYSRKSQPAAKQPS